MKKLGFIQIFAVGLLLVMILPVSSTTYSEEPVDCEPMEIGDRFRKANYEIAFKDNMLPTAASPRASGGIPNETIKSWLTLDDFDGYYYFTEFMLEAMSDTAEIWVALDRAFPEGDPRNLKIEITDAQVAYLLNEFDTNILPTDVEYFGEPDYHDGTYSLLEAWGYAPPGYWGDDMGRNVILVSNFIDDSYYDPTYPSYIAGFYSSTFELYFDRNIISIDCYDWANRIGGDVARPYVYESTIAHEYQHLIHDDWNTDDPSFMNEGCSMYAEVLCGYPIDWGYINRYLAVPDNSLIEWGDLGDIAILADYGESLLWTMYLSDHYGGSAFVSHFVKAGIPGVTGINAALEYFGFRDRFMDVYHNWRIANLIHSGWGKYNYKSIDLGESETGLRVYPLSGLPVPFTAGTDFGTTITLDGDDTEISALPMFGTDYIRIDDLPRRYPLSIMEFIGDDLTYVPGWELTADGWYSGTGNLKNVLLYGETYVDPTNPLLTITTYWDMEDYWDFGFIQISTDGGDTWTSLANEYTTLEYDPSAHPDVKANVPGLTSWVTDWITMSFDLTAYAGMDVLVGFRFVTDWATYYYGWLIQDNVVVGGAPVTLMPYYPPADFLVTVVEVTERHHKTKYQVYDLRLDDLNDGWQFLFTEGDSYIYLIISSISDAGIVDYGFSIDKFHKFHHWHC